MGMCQGKSRVQKSHSQQRTSQNNTTEKGPETASVYQRRSDAEKIARSPQHQQLTVLFESYQLQRDQFLQTPRTVRSHQTIILSKKGKDAFQFIDNDFIQTEPQSHSDNNYNYYTNKYTGRIYQVYKHQNINQASTEDLVRMNKQLLVHPHIVEILILQTEENEKKNTIYYEYCQGDTLNTFYQKKGNLTLEQISILVEQIIEILTHLHSQKLFHNNLDLQSFSLFQDNKFLYLKLTNITGIFNESNNQKIKSSDIDIEQVGFITFQLLSSQNCLENLQQRDQDYWIENIKMNLILPSSIMGINARSLILSMLQQHPQNKIKLDQISKNLFIENGKLEFLKHHKSKLIPKNSHKKINYLQKCFAVFVIQNFVPHQYLIMKKIYDYLEKEDEQKINLTSFCELLSQIFNQNEDVTQDYRYMIEQNESISFRDFLVMNSNLSRYLSSDNLRNSFHMLSNKSQYISRKSILNMMDANSQSVTQEFEKHCLKWRFTYDHYLQFMERIK